MKPLPLSVVVGILLALAIIYWLAPLNTGAVTLVVVLCVGLSAGVGALFHKSRKEGPQ